jgi:hypothetical protein
VRKGYGEVNITQIVCPHVCKWENDTCSNYSRNGGGRVKEKGEGGEFKYDIFDIL